MSTSRAFYQASTNTWRTSPKNYCLLGVMHNRQGEPELYMDHAIDDAKLAQLKPTMPAFIYKLCRVALTNRKAYPILSTSNKLKPNGEYTMRVNTFLPIAILALNAGSEQVERELLKQAGFNAIKPLEGVYKGERERSWLVCLSDGDEAVILDLAEAHNQESILFSGRDRAAHLHYLAGDQDDQLLGVLTEVPESIAKQQDSYTFDPATGKYWVTA